MIKKVYIILISVLIVSCGESQLKDVTTEPQVVYKCIRNETLADVAYDLLRFGKWEAALDIFEGDTSTVADGVRARVYEAIGEFRDAIYLDVRGLRQYDGHDFFEGSWILCEMYRLCLREIDYAISLLEEERLRCPSNYQVRLLLMKLYWANDALEKVVRMGDEFRQELPDMSQDVCFNYWRQDSLDSLSAKNLINLSTNL